MFGLPSVILSLKNNFIVMRNDHLFKLQVNQIRVNQGVEKSNVILENIRKSKLTVDFELVILYK